MTGVVTVGADAASASGIARVEFFRDGGVSLGVASAAPYAVSWNTAGLAQGVQYRLYATAVDAAGNSASSPLVSVVLRDTAPPAVAIASPAGGTVVNGSVAISASASDNVGVTKIEILVDGTLLATGTSAPFSATWNSAAAAAGTHVLTARAYDQANNAATSTAVSVAKDSANPTVSLTQPAANASVSGLVALAATASDNTGVDRVAFSRGRRAPHRRRVVAVLGHVERRRRAPRDSHHRRDRL